MFTLGSGRLKLGTWLSGGLYTQVSGVSVTPSTASGSVPAGTYYVRVAGKNAAGVASPSATYIGISWGRRMRTDSMRGSSIVAW